MPVKEYWSEGSLEVALAAKFCGPEFAFLPQVRNCTGYSRRVRTADALAFGLWPSRGLHLHGFEIKISRADWLAEKKNPEKAEAIQQYCDYWWLVVSDNAICQPGELPPSWGLLVPKGQKLVVAKEAELNESPQAFDRPFLASLLRKASQSLIDDEKLTAAVRKASTEAYERGKADRQQEVDRLNNDLSRVRGSILEFERLSGIKINSSYGGGNIGAYVRVAMRYDWESFRRKISEARMALMNIVYDCDNAINSSRNGEMTDYSI